MSDAAREEDYYQPMPAQPALAPSEPRYQTGLPLPVAAANANEGMRFKGAMGGAAVGNEYPDHEPRLSVPYNRYKQLETADPTLYEAINHVAEEQRIPPTDLAALVYASSGNDPDARDGPRVGYTGLTVNDSRQLDPEGQLDINKPVDNLFLGAEKYKRIAARYGMGTASAFAAYHAGPDRVDGVLQHHGDQHRSVAPPGMFEFVNRVAGRSPELQKIEDDSRVVDITQQDRVLKPEGSSIPAGDAIYRGEGPGIERIPGFREQVPQRGRPRPLRVSSAVPEDAGAGTLGAEPASGGNVEEMARQAAGQPPQRFTPTSQPVSPMVPTLPPPGSELRAWPQYAPGTEPSDATREIIRERATNPAPPYFTPGRPAIGSEPNYNLDPNAPIPTTPTPPPAVAGVEPFGPQYPPPPVGPPPAPPPGPDYTPPPRDVISAPTVMPPPGAPSAVPPDVAAALPQPGRIGRAPYSQVGGTGDYGGGGEPSLPVMAGGGQRYVGPAPTTGSARPRAALAPSTDTMAAQLNQQELARLQAGRPDVIPTGPTQALAGAPLPPGAPSPQAMAAAPPGGAPPAEGAGTSTTPPPAAATRAAGPFAGPDAAKVAATTGQPPIDRLNTNTGTMSGAGAVRASAAGGPNGVLTYITRSGRRGASTGDVWNNLQDGMIREALLRGDVQAAMHAKEFVFEIQHQGAMDNLMRAIGAWGGDPNAPMDPNGVAQFLAKSHAFVTDGQVMGFQPVNNQVWTQRYDEQTHDKIGVPFQITREGLVAQAMANSDRKNFFNNMVHAQTANETARHNRMGEAHQEKALTETVKDREERSKQRQHEFELEHQRKIDALQSEQDRKTHEADLERQRKVEALASEQLRKKEESELRAHEKDLARIEAAGKLNEGRAKQVQEDTTQYFGQGDIAGTAVDINGKAYTGDALRTARDHFYAIGLHNHRPAEEVADIVKGLMAGTYKSIPYSDGKIYFKDMTQKDEKGEPLDLGITVPRHALQRYLPPGLSAPVGAQPPPRATQK